MQFKGRLTKYKKKKIIECFCLDIDATKTSMLLKLNRKTINRYYRYFREIVYRYQMYQMKEFVGVIEVDESYFGAHRLRGKPGPRKRGRGTNKQPVFGVFERNGRVYTEIISDVRAETLQRIIRGKVSFSSKIISDGWRGYDGLVDFGFDKHFRVNHSNGFSSKGHHINGIEAFWSFTKRRLAKFNGVKKNFKLHLKECEWRWNKNFDILFKELVKLV